jgi:arabinofuranosyltransferase
MKFRFFHPFTAIVLLFGAHAFFYFWALGTDAVDDAYISFRYAQNAIRGYGLVFNPGERVEGFTNFLWTAAMIPFEGAHADVGRASMLLGGLFALSTIFIVVRFSKMVATPQGAGWLAALLLVMDGSFVLWAISGLETILFAFLIFAGAFLYIREQEDIQTKTRALDSSFVFRLASNIPTSGIFFALAAMTRPEGLLVFAITVAHQATWRILSERRLFVTRDVLRICAFGAIFAPYWLGRWGYYRSFLPNSFHAKVSAAGPSAQIERGWNHLSQFIGVHLGWLVALPPVIGLTTSLWRWTKERNAIQRSTSGAFWTTYFAAIILPYVLYIVYVGGDWSVGRFFAPLMPFFYLLFSTGLAELWKTPLETRAHSWGQHVDYIGATLVLLLVTLIGLSSSWNGEYGIFIRGFDAANATTARVTMGRWLKANVARGTLIAVDAAGQVPYFSELPSVDMFGINDLHIGRLQVSTLGQGTPGHEKFDLVYVIMRQPEYVIIYGNLLDNVKEYARAQDEWSTDKNLLKFLSIYQRKK